MVPGEKRKGVIMNKKRSTTPRDWAVATHVLTTFHDYAAAAKYQLAVGGELMFHTGTKRKVGEWVKVG